MDVRGYPRPLRGVNLRRPGLDRAPARPDSVRVEPQPPAPQRSGAAVAAPALVVALGRAGGLPVDALGPKAHGLVRLLGAGLPVPDGVVVTTAAWRLVERALGLDAALAGLDPSALGPAAAALAARVRAAEVPPQVRGALEEAVAALGPGPLAVRSSALDEDLDDASAAGLFTTVLDVRGPAAVEDALRACWASLLAAPAVAYRRDRGRPACGGAMAVVVQRQVAPRAAGVLFTRPDGGALVEAVDGPGRLLVDGLRDPARYELPADLAPIRAAARPPLLGEPQLAALQDVVRRVEPLFGPGRGVDVEWAIDAADRLHVLQARPVTREVAPGGAGRIRWTAANTQEALLDPVTPLTWSVLAPLVEEGRRGLFRLAGLPEVEGPGYMRLFQGRPYFNPDYFRAFLRLIPGLPETIFDALIFGESAGPIDLRLPRLGRRAARLLLLLLLARLLAQERFELFLRVLAVRLRWLDPGDASRLDDAALVDARRRATSLAEGALRRHVIGTAISGAAYLLLELFLERTGARAAVGQGKLVAHLVAGAPGSALAVASGRLERLAARAAARPGLLKALSGPSPPRTLDALAALGRDGRRLSRELLGFLARFGHRCEKEAELLEPRWADDPSVLLGVLAGAVRAEGAGPVAPPLAEREARLASRARSLAARVSAHLASSSLLERLLPAQRLAFRALLREARRYAPWRENLKDGGLRALHLVRRLFIEMGARLHARGRLDRPDDIFFLEVDEAEAALLGRLQDDLRPRVAGRRAERAASLAAEPPRHVIEVPGRPPRPVHLTADTDVRLIEGVGVSGGKVTARARVLAGLEDAARLGAGEVVVARVVNAGWTPLFHLAGAVVAEVGGVLSHAAIVAREYGIPAVFGAAGATRIPDGALVTVDGDLGIVTLESTGPA